ncbi:XRE family transcriptional regulator, partial [bacterium]|nr:XRE family transcriptional regulator [bacterium]
MATRTKFAISEIIREARQRKYKTAKDFWSENEEALKASYTHYAAIETGTKLPDIELAISAAKILKIDLR